jgi:hypothetical protein
MEGETGIDWSPFLFENWYIFIDLELAQILDLRSG